MNVQEKMNLLKSYAYQKINSREPDGPEEGLLISGWINEDDLKGVVTDEEIDQAERLCDFEIDHFKGEINIPTYEKQELLEWMQSLASGDSLAENVKCRIQKAVEFLRKDWQMPA